MISDWSVLRMKLEAFRAIAWDFDGVLCDSSTPFHLILCHALAVRGYSGLRPDRIHGRSNADIERDLTWSGVASAAEVLAEAAESYTRYAHDHARVDDSAIAVLAELHGGGKQQCIVSNGDPSIISATLARTDLGEIFAGVVTPGAYRDKPSPDMYLAAVALMGEESEHTAVVEDSAVGAQAGVAAGLKVIRFSPFDS